MGTLLDVRNLNKHFKVPKGLLYAVNDVSFQLEENQILGIVGESGCGKSTLGRVIVHLLEKTSGEIYFDGEDISNVTKSEIKSLRLKMQMIFQDPYSSLNPRMTVSDIIGEPIRIYFPTMSRNDYQKKINTIMDTVGIERRIQYSYPHELDGGRRQRIGIARALILEPKFLVCDEPVSALDVSIQAQVLNLLKELQRERGFSCLFITHDLSVVKHISDHITVMYLGRMVERASSRELFKNQLHPYTKALLSAIPIPRCDIERKRVVIQGEIVSPINIKECCQFSPRCPYATEVCRNKVPQFEEVFEGHFVECHHVRKINALAEGDVLHGS